MSPTSRLFGEDQSTNFKESLPDITKKSLFFRSISIGCVVFFVITVGLILFALLGGGFGPSLEVNEKYIVVFPAIYITVSLLSIKHFYPDKNTLLMQLKSLSAREVLKHVFIIATVLFIFSVVTSTFSYINNPESIEDNLKYFTSNQDSILGNEVFDFILLSIVWLSTGVGEELFFRGGIYRSLRKHYNIVISALVVSFVFAIFHPIGTGNMVLMFSFSLIYSIYFEYKNNLLTITILHSLQDLVFAGLANLVAMLLAKSILSL